MAKTYRRSRLLKPTRLYCPLFLTNRGECDTLKETNLTRLPVGNRMTRSEGRQVYCQDCNTGNTVDSKYCKECGAKINSGYRTMMLSIQDLPLNQSDEEVEKLTRLLDMAFWHNQAGNQEAAITACEAALALNPSSTTAHSLLGTLYEKTGDDDKAIRHFESVLALNPESQADAAKLEQLRRGVHVRAVAPPIAHQLLPPALLKLGPQLQQKWAALSSAPLPAGLSRVDPERRPLIAAGAATALVALGGLLLAHPWAQAETVKTYPIAAPSAVAVSRSAFAPETQSSAQMASATPPMVLLPSRANTTTPNSFPAAITTHDPFAGHIPAPYSSAPPAGGSPLWTLPAVPRTAARFRSEESLPPLRLAALPSVGSVAPAPVMLPPGGLPAAPDTLPRHTVMVGSLGSAAPVAAPSGYTSSPYNSSPYASDLSSHIRITVHQSTDVDTPAASSGVAGSNAGTVSGGSGSGESEQQRALALQEAGSYPQARQAYLSAIKSYQAQIAAGQNPETAQRGLTACQTGLQICQQSQ
jgi:hypothetical protein